MTNSNQYFKFNDKVLVDGELCTILRSKHSSLPSGHQSYKYQLNGADGKLVVIDGESWLMQAELKVKHQACGLTFREMMQDLKGYQGEWE